MTHIADSPLSRQVEALEQALRTNATVLRLLDLAPALGVPAWYLGAGAVVQTVWNGLHGFEPQRGINDYDLVYFDDADLSREAEEGVEERAAQLFPELEARLDLTNEARVHLWYEERFGRRIEPYRSSEHAIRTWPTTASCVGVRYDDGEFVVCAPFGLTDLFGMVVRPNKALIDRAEYEARVDRWSRIWPDLSILPW